MKPTTYAIAAVAASFVLFACNKQKAAINETENATKEAIETRKAEVNAEAKYATDQTDMNAEIDKARIEADKVSTQAQLDADKKKAEAESDAAKANVDAGNE